MTVLLIDIGNSCVKWACLEASNITDSERFYRSKTGIKASLNKAFKHLNGIDSVLVSNVAGEKIAKQLAEWTEQQWQITPRFIHSEHKRFGIVNGYRTPEQLGVDRWLNLVAVSQGRPQARCIIDCGTAITIDIINASGEHQGGLILPGLKLMREALAAGTDALTEAEDDSGYSLLATNTFSAIQAGTLYSISATLQQIISDMRQNFKDISITVTGGDGETVISVLGDSSIRYDADLVLKGLSLYAKPDTKPEKAKPRRRRRPSKQSAKDSAQAPAGPLPDAAN